MTFHVGQKIVCVTDNWQHSMRHLVPNIPRKGGIYHVRGHDPTVVAPDCVGHEYIWLCEIANPRVGLTEPSFLAAHFRPVIERSTDISIFTAMLNPRRSSKERAAS
jgi:hypothetical protein